MRWTDEMRGWFKANAPDSFWYETAAAFQEEFGVALNRSQVKNARQRFGAKSGKAGGRFPKGHTPANKGKTWDEFMSPEGQANSRRTQFKHGEIHGPEGHVKPVGYERVSKDGYIEVKVADGLQSRANCNYRPKHHVVWEQANGPIPPHTMIVFADRDKRNFDPDNLVAVDRSIWSTISSKGFKYADRESLEACINVVKLKRAVYEKRLSPRTCRECGAEFKPTFANQSRCRPCIDRRKHDRVR